MGKSAFVTGGTGFVGSHLVELLLRSGYDDAFYVMRMGEKIDRLYSDNSITLAESS